MSNIPKQGSWGEPEFGDGWAYAVAATVVLRNWVLWLRLTITLVLIVVILVLLRSHGM